MNMLRMSRGPEFDRGALGGPGGPGGPGAGAPAQRPEDAYMANMRRALDEFNSNERANAMREFRSGAAVTNLQDTGAFSGAMGDLLQNMYRAQGKEGTGLLFDAAENEAGRQLQRYGIDTGSRDQALDRGQREGDSLRDYALGNRGANLSEKRAAQDYELAKQGYSQAEIQSLRQMQQQKEENALRLQLGQMNSADNRYGADTSAAASGYGAQAQLEAARLNSADRRADRQSDDSYRNRALDSEIQYKRDTLQQNQNESTAQFRQRQDQFEANLREQARQADQQFTLGASGQELNKYGEDNAMQRFMLDLYTKFSPEQIQALLFGGIGVPGTVGTIKP